MIEHGKISPSQFGILIFLFVLGTAVLYLPMLVTSISRQDAWISIALSILPALAVAFLINSLASRFPNETVVQYSQRILGKGLGRLIAIFYILFYLILSSMVLRAIGDFMTTAILVQTPIDIIHAMFMVAVAYAVACGLEVAARVGEVLFPWVLVLVALMLILLVNQMDFSQLLPVMPQGILQPVKGVYPALGLPIFECSVFLMLFPFVVRQQEAQRRFYISVTGVGITGIILMMAIESVLGADVTARSPYAIYEAARQVRVGDFLEHLEAIIVVGWFITVFIKLVIVFYATNLATAQLFRLKDYRPLILPYSILVSASAIHLSPNNAFFSWFRGAVWPVFTFIPGVVIPLLLLAVAAFRRLRNP